MQHSQQSGCGKEEGTRVLGTIDDKELSGWSGQCAAPPPPGLHGSGGRWCDEEDETSSQECDSEFADDQQQQQQEQPKPELCDPELVQTVIGADGSLDLQQEPEKTASAPAAAAAAEIARKNRAAHDHRNAVIADKVVHALQPVPVQYGPFGIVALWRWPSFAEVKNSFSALERQLLMDQPRHGRDFLSPHQQQFWSTFDFDAGTERFVAMMCKESAPGLSETAAREFLFNHLHAPLLQLGIFSLAIFPPASLYHSVIDPGRNYLKPAVNTNVDPSSSSSSSSVHDFAVESGNVLLFVGGLERKNGEELPNAQRLSAAQQVMFIFFVAGCLPDGITLCSVSGEDCAWVSVPRRMADELQQRLHRRFIFASDSALLLRSDRDFPLALIADFLRHKNDGARKQSSPYALSVVEEARLKAVRRFVRQSNRDAAAAAAGGDASPRQYEEAIDREFAEADPHCALCRDARGPVHDFDIDFDNNNGSSWANLINYSQQWGSYSVAVHLRHNDFCIHELGARAECEAALVARTVNGNFRELWPEFVVRGVSKRSCARHRAAVPGAGAAWAWEATWKEMEHCMKLPRRFASNNLQKRHPTLLDEKRTQALWARFARFCRRPLPLVPPPSPAAEEPQPAPASAPVSSLAAAFAVPSPPARAKVPTLRRGGLRQ